jgi:hypothetical protein
MTGVPVMPTSGVIESQSWLLATRSVPASIGRAPAASSEVCQSGPGSPVAVASKA